MKSTNNTIKAAALVVLTAFACWLLFRVEVSALGGMEIHECSL